MIAKHVNDRTILIVNQRDRYGGAARNAWDQFQGLKRQGERVYMTVGFKQVRDTDVYEILRPAPGLSSWSRLFWRANQFVERYEGKIRGARRLRRLLQNISYPQAAIERRRGWEDFNFPGTGNLLKMLPVSPSVLHLYNLHSDYFDLRFLPSLTSLVPTVVTLLDTWLLAGHCGYSLGCPRWETGCGQCPHLKLYPAIQRDASAFNWQRKKEIYSRSKIFAAVPSRWMAERIGRSILAPAVREIRVIPSGVDQVVFQPGNRAEVRKVLGLPQAARILLFVAQGTHANPFKDVATMEKAIQQIYSQNRYSDVIFLCLGQENKPANQKPPAIQHLPYTSDDSQLVRYYQAADIYLHAAHEDTFPNVVLEAMSCGLPVIASSVGGIPEQINEGQTGFLTPESNAEEMAQRITILLNDLDLCRRMGEQARQITIQNFSIDRSVERYREYYSIIQEIYERS